MWHSRGPGFYFSYRKQHLYLKGNGSCGHSFEEMDEKLKLATLLPIDMYVCMVTQIFFFHEVSLS